MKIASILTAGIMVCCADISLFAQNGVGIGTNSPNSHAVLDVFTTTFNKGIMIPKVANTSLFTGMTAADEGLLVYNTTVDNFQFYNGSVWLNVGMPPGAIVMWSGTTAPAGWALCDGSPGTPDLRGRFVVGYQSGAPTAPAVAGDQQINYGLIGNTGGQVGVSLTSPDQLASHTHGVSIGDNVHSHSYNRHPSKQVGENAGGGEPAANPAGGVPTPTDLVSHSHAAAISHTGSGLPHENRPPYYVLAYIIKL